MRSIATRVTRRVVEPNVAEMSAALAVITHSPEVAEIAIGGGISLHSHRDSAACLLFFLFCNVIEFPIFSFHF